MLGILALINVGVLAAFHLYNNLWEYASIDEALQIVFAILLSTLIGAVFLWVIDVRLPIRVFVVGHLLVLIMGGHPHGMPRPCASKKRVLASAQRACRPAAHARRGRRRDRLPRHRPHGLEGSRSCPACPSSPPTTIPSKRGLPHPRRERRPAPTRRASSRWSDRYDIEQIVVAISRLPPRRSASASTPSCTEDRVQACKHAAQHPRAVASTRLEATLRLARRGRRRPAAWAARRSSSTPAPVLRGYIAGECVVLVTGGGGSIGSELCRQLCRTWRPRASSSSSIYENDAYMLRQRADGRVPPHRESSSRSAACATRPAWPRCSRSTALLPSSTPRRTSTSRSMEACPREALHNNVFGTLNVVHTRPTRYGASRASSSSPPTRP